MIYVFSNNPNLQPYLLHSQIDKYKLAAWQYVILKIILL